MPRREIETSTSHEGETRNSSPQCSEGRKSILQMMIEDKERETKTILGDIEKAKKRQERRDIPKFESIMTAVEHVISAIKTEIKESDYRATKEDKGTIVQMQYMIKLSEEFSEQARRKNILEVARIWDKMRGEANKNIYIGVVVKRIGMEENILRLRMLEKERTRRERQSVEAETYLSFAIPDDGLEKKIEEVKALIKEEEKTNRSREEAWIERQNMRMKRIKAQGEDTSFLGMDQEAAEAAPQGRELPDTSSNTPRMESSRPK